MKKHIAATVLMLGLSVSGFAGAETKLYSVNETDKQFVTKVTQGSLAEIKSGTLAKSKSHYTEVKKIGETMIDDHSKAKNELKEAAQQAKLTLPSEPNSAQQANYKKLTVLKSPQFDRTYLKQQIVAHQQTVDLFKKEIAQGQNSAIKDFASRTLPTIEHHLSMAKDADAKFAKQKK